MLSRTIKQLFATASVGSIILVSAMPVNAGRMFKEEPSRPHTFAGCQPAWGYNQTCWQRFPALPPCDSNGNCFGQPSDGTMSYNHSGSVYAPQQSGAVVDPGFSEVQSLTPGPHSPQMFVPNHGTADSSTEQYHGAPMQNPAIQAPRYQYSAPPQTQSLELGAPSAEQPSQEVPPAPTGTLALPPLPAPPTAVPAVPGQTRFQPQYEQLMIGTDGRLTTATAMNRNQGGYAAGASRYGQISRPVSSQQIPMPSVPNRTGPPVRFADAVASPGTHQNQRSTQPVRTATRPASSRNNNPSGTLARTVSQGHNTLPANSSRYGVTRPAASVSTAPAAVVVEPLRKTPGSYR